MNEIIARNEIFNDGKTIHLYFNGLVGLYAAYGVSAYLLSKCADVTPSYSESMQMPVVVINTMHYGEVAQKLSIRKDVGNYRCLAVEEGADMKAYDEWASALRSGKEL